MHSNTTKPFWCTLLNVSLVFVSPSNFPNAPRDPLNANEIKLTHMYTQYVYRYILYLTTDTQNNTNTMHMFTYKTKQKTKILYIPYNTQHNNQNQLLPSIYSALCPQTTTTQHKHIIHINITPI